MTTWRFDAFLLGIGLAIALMVVGMATKSMWFIVGAVFAYMVLATALFHQPPIDVNYNE